MPLHRFLRPILLPALALVAACGGQEPSVRAGGAPIAGMRVQDARARDRGAARRPARRGARCLRVGGPRRPGAAGRAQRPGRRLPPRGSRRGGAAAARRGGDQGRAARAAGGARQPRRPLRGRRAIPPRRRPISRPLAASTPGAPSRPSRWRSWPTPAATPTHHGSRARGAAARRRRLGPPRLRLPGGARPPRGALRRGRRGSAAAQARWRELRAGRASGPRARSAAPPRGALVLQGQGGAHAVPRARAGQAGAGDPARPGAGLHPHRRAGGEPDAPLPPRPRRLAGHHPQRHDRPRGARLPGEAARLLRPHPHRARLPALRRHARSRCGHPRRPTGTASPGSPPTSPDVDSLLGGDRRPAPLAVAPRRRGDHPAPRSPTRSASVEFVRLRENRVLAVFVSEAGHRHEQAGAARGSLHRRRPGAGRRLPDRRSWLAPASRGCGTPSSPTCAPTRPRCATS